MGIQGLVGFLGKRAPGSIRPWTGNSRIVRVAVDATLYLCRFFYADRDIVTPEQLARAYTAFHHSLKYKQFEPIHVFDGDSFALKRFAHEKRAKAREAGARRLADLRA
jgi:XPG N-terminal domain